MFYKRFNFVVVLRLVLIMVNFVVLTMIFGDKRLFFNQIILSVVLVIQIFDLLRYINQTNRELARLFLAIRHSDFSVTFKQSRLGNAFKELQESMADIIDTYKQVKVEKEGQFHFLQLLVNHVNVGIIALKNDDITLINPTAELTLDAKGVKNWKILKQLNPAFADHVDKLGENVRQLIEVQTNEGKKFISVQVSPLIILDEKHRLITLHDINSEIEQKEIEAWHKLIRILTHEIMNSVTPISSLTETLEALLIDRAGNPKHIEDLTDENLHDIRFSLETIRKRSDGLLNFIDSYRKLTRVPKPHKEKINVKTWIQEVRVLMSAELDSKRITFSINVDENLSIEGDRVLLQQLMINLVTNSIHALEHRPAPAIVISSKEDGAHALLIVGDNGKGISQKELSQIFVPFFSTKKEGSGIGLSLSKQIMSSHGGSIQVKSAEDVGTEMLLRFRKQ
jgi:two-component system, NtrC family, nitrogen regulation sensor histidine kinase NtrY